MKMKKRRLFN